MSVLIEEHKAVVYELFEEVYNHHDIDAVDRLYAADYMNHTAGFRGSDRMKELYIDLLKEHPNLYIDLEDIIAEVDKVVTRWTLYNDENPVSTGITIHRVRHGKIVEDWYSSHKVE